MSARACVPVLAAGAVVALAGCGGSTSPSVANVGVGATTSQEQLQQQLLQFAQCMRAHGVPDFPDPSPSGGFQFGANPASPAFQAAHAKCQMLLPERAGIARGATTHPSAKWLAQMVAAAECMRSHGVPDFPDPRTSIPTDLTAVREVSNIDGVIFVFPTSLDTQSAAFARAAASCKFPLRNH